MQIEFNPFPKIARLTRNCVITEKLDGTNAQIYITESGDFLCGSRTRWITPEQDNYGFAAWAYAHKEELLKLGPGAHFGEWWGKGIQRNYGIAEKRFSLFNTRRWCLSNQEPKLIRNTTKMQERLPSCCSLVPELYVGLFSTDRILKELDTLRLNGSYAAPGFMNPEGIVIYHEAAGILFKKTLEKDEEPKSISTH